MLTGWLGSSTGLHTWIPFQISRVYHQACVCTWKGPYWNKCISGSDFIQCHEIWFGSVRHTIQGAPHRFVTASHNKNRCFDELVFIIAFYDRQTHLINPFESHVKALHLFCVIMGRLISMTNFNSLGNLLLSNCTTSGWDSLVTFLLFCLCYVFRA